MSLFKKVLQTSPAYQAAKLGKQQLDKHKKQATEQPEVASVPAEKTTAKPGTAEPQSTATPEAKPPELVMPLSGRGEKIVNQNMSEDEKILVKLQGNNGQALVMTNKRLYIVKWGFVAGNTFGGKCVGYEYKNVTALEINKHMVNHIFQVLTPATQHQKLQTIGGREKGTNATESDFAITYSNSKVVPLFQVAVNKGRQIIEKAHETSGSQTAADDGGLQQLERLAELKDKGILTNEEFQAKKKQILGL